VATVAVVGPEPTALVEQFFRPRSGKSLDQFPPSRIVLGRWTGQTGAEEEVVVARREPQRVEVHCHGGRAAVRAVVEDLIGLGCREVPWPEFVSWLAADRLIAEATIALAAACTERTAAVLMDQYRGALGAAVRQVLAEISAGDTATAAEALRRLSRRGDFGLHLTRPWRVAVAGCANVGKSSLINALLGYPRSIVYHEPGTTRDVVTAWTAIDGWPVELADTAGLRDSHDALEAAGMALAREHLAAADAVLLAIDSTQPWTCEDQRLQDAWPDALLVDTKCDLPPAGPAGPGGRPAGLRTSARTGDGLVQLLQALAARLVPEPPAPGAAVPFTPPQVAALRSALTALEAGDARQATLILTSLCGPRPESASVRTGASLVPTADSV